MERKTIDVLMTEGKRIIGENQWESWMSQPIPTLQNMTPKELCKTAYGRWELLQLLNEMDSGQPS